MRSIAAIFALLASSVAPADDKPKGIDAETASPKAARHANPDPRLAPVEDQPGLPRVLLIGDSVSKGYTLPVRELLKGKANLHRIPANGHATIHGLATIDEWLGDKKWDVIHFNWGIHDLKITKQGTRQVEPDDYVKNLRRLVARLKATGARLIWATTTPIPEGEFAPRQPFGKVPEYNNIARGVMVENGVAIDDLNAAVTPHLAQYQKRKEVHYTPEGSAFLAVQVAASINAALETAK